MRIKPSLTVGLLTLTTCSAYSQTDYLSPKTATASPSTLPHSQFRCAARAQSVAERLKLLLRSRLDRPTGRPDPIRDRFPAPGTNDLAHWSIHIQAGRAGDGE